MSLRSSTIYVEPRTLKRLLVIQKLYPQRTRDYDGGNPRDKTADEIANALLTEAIEAKYPKVFELERALAKAEDEFISNLQKKE